ncbi:glutamate-rich protein 2 isoform X1 [Tursiops truncatus]|uniref:Glutamate-rich protein 2 isoform X1 n=2 Tax=Tursiops truncatus TaxID=9739 RepID=A0A6J3RNS0_TURTR|nr:glutamate-rich protein 2 isoform X1 [Tursiops truncatus]XP_033715918.1 glutamate-rich protein 2 isoform X1 [Tursiops truncatus]
MIEPNGAMSDKCLFRCRPTLASKLYTSPTQVSLNVAKTVSEKTFRMLTTRGLEQVVGISNFSDSGEMSKNVVITEQEKNNEYSPEDTDDKLSESTDDDGEDDTNDEDNEEDSNPNKDTHAPLELMTEFLRSEMGQDYHLAKKLCQKILIYEPENPEAKEFSSLIEEMLLMEKAQNLEEDDEESEEDSSGESEGESSEDPSEESSDECEDG